MAIYRQHPQSRLFRFCTGKYTWSGSICHYQLEYSIVNDALTRVHASIRKKDTDGSGNAPQIGIIYMEQGVISCNIPMGEPLAPLFHDFDTMIDEIKKSNVQNA